MANADSTYPGKPYQPNFILRWFYRRFFSHITVDEQWSANVREAASRGVVIYVMRSISFLDFFCLDFLVKRFSLPLVRFVNDLGLWIIEPFGKGRRRLGLRRQVPEARALGDTVKEKFSALLFLRRPPKIGESSRKGSELEVDLIRTLVEQQRKIDEPILLVPQTFVWSKLPPNHKRNLLDLFFGPSEWPGKVRVFFQFLLNFRNALLRSGEPFDLQRFLHEHQDLTDGEVADKVRYALLRIIERERSLVLGPSKKTTGRIREELLRSPRVRKQVSAQARARKKPEAKILREARKDLKKLCADQDPYTLALLKRFFDWFWNRIYDGLEVDQEGVERLRQAARSGSLILLPSHKSHIDYLILSDVLYSNALSPPLIAAGDNLNFFPVGGILRRGGAFFIRRSFRGRKLYAALVDAYIRKLLVEGFHIEFFLEGGRSRTGKLLAPKFGLLSMIVDAALLLPGRKVHFVPVSIGYERVIEARSYVDEAAGGEKKKENIGGLLRSGQILRSRYGRLYVQFGEILSFEDLLKQSIGDEPRSKLTPAKRRNLIQRSAYRVIDQINRVTVVTPSALVATVLLAHQRRGMTQRELEQWANELLDLLSGLGARIAKSLSEQDGALRAPALYQATQLFVDSKLLNTHGEGDETIYTIPEERRIGLEYYKNNILHFFVPRAMISAAICEHTGPLKIEDIREEVRDMSKLLKHEFVYPADATFDGLFDETIHAMAEAGDLTIDGDTLTRGDEDERLPFFAAMIRTYLETYRLADHGVETLLDSPLAKKEWLKKTLALGQRLYLSGELTMRESLSKHRLENALLSLRDRGVIRLGDTLEVKTPPEPRTPSGETRLAAPPP
ncbi:MAG: 1-acyl-sn-glycerol-3-phosphate acyltransferase [Myxococcota bacterium]